MKVMDRKILKITVLQCRTDDRSFEKLGVEYQPEASWRTLQDNEPPCPAASQTELEQD